MADKISVPTRPMPMRDTGNAEQTIRNYTVNDDADKRGTPAGVQPDGVEKPRGDR